MLDRKSDCKLFEEIENLLTCIFELRTLNAEAKKVSFTYEMEKTDECWKKAIICHKIDQAFNEANYYIRNVSVGEVYHSCIKFTRERLENLIERIKTLLKELAEQ